MSMADRSRVSRSRQRRENPPEPVLSARRNSHFTCGGHLFPNLSPGAVGVRPTDVADAVRMAKKLGLKGVDND
jgi:hypothetical protein